MNLLTSSFALSLFFISPLCFAASDECPDTFLKEALSVAEKKITYASEMAKSKEAYISELKSIHKEALGGAQVSVGATAALTGLLMAPVGMFAGEYFASSTCLVQGNAVQMFWAAAKNAACKLQDKVGADAFRGIVATGTAAVVGAQPVIHVVAKSQGGQLAVSDMYAVTDEALEKFPKVRMSTSKDLLESLRAFSKEAQERHDAVSKNYDLNYAKLPKNDKGNLANRWHTFGVDNVKYVDLVLAEGMARKALYQQELVALLQFKMNVQKACAALGSKSSSSNTTNESGASTHEHE